MSYDLFHDAPYKRGDRVWVDIGVAKLRSGVVERAVGFNTESGHIYRVRIEGHEDVSLHSRDTISPVAAVDLLGEIADA
jgi:hypothetical protein